MSQQMRFFYKNKADYSNELVTVVASEGQEFARRPLNRSNLTSWVTTGSLDANNTTYEVDFNEPRNIDSLILVLHNFKSFLVEYYDGSTWLDMPTPIDVTNCTDATSFFQFDLTAMESIRITIRGTQVADSDKQLYQFIATQQLGQFQGWPVIAGMKHDQNKQITKMLSGRSSIHKNLGALSFEFAVNVWRNSDDIALVQALYSSTEGFLVWISGGDLTQFSMSVKGYRLEDIFLMECLNDLSPNFFSGVYSAGLANLKTTLIEVNE